jgi:hypothetical protein
MILIQEDHGIGQRFGLVIIRDDLCLRGGIDSQDFGLRRFFGDSAACYAKQRSRQQDRNQLFHQNASPLNLVCLMDSRSGGKPVIGRSPSDLDNMPAAPRRRCRQLLKRITEPE